MATARSGPDPGEPGAIGVLGSAFNPPHFGHLVLAGEAKWRLGLDEILLVPTGDPYHKEVLADRIGQHAVRLAAHGDIVHYLSRGDVDHRYAVVEAVGDV